MDATLDFFRQNDQFARHIGIELIDATPGRAQVKMQIQPFHLNAAGTVHGGAIFSLADFAFAVAANSRGQAALGINTATTFIKAARGGTLYGVAEELSLTRRLSSYQVKISDENQQLIAQFTGTAYRKDEPLLPAAVVNIDTDDDS